METATLTKINNDISILKQEVDVLRSLLVSFVWKDKEGSYKPALVKDLKKAINEASDHSFKDADSFLNQLANL